MIRTNVFLSVSKKVSSQESERHEPPLRIILPRSFCQTIGVWIPTDRRKQYWRDRAGEVVKVFHGKKGVF